MNILDVLGCVLLEVKVVNARRLRDIPNMTLFLMDKLEMRHAILLSNVFSRILNNIIIL